jgi:hypothetical protein
MQHLLRKQIITGALLLCISFASMAQRGDVYQPFHDDLPYYLGMSIGLNNNYLNFNRNVAINPLLSVDGSGTDVTLDAKVYEDKSYFLEMHAKYQNTEMEIWLHRQHGDLEETMKFLKNLNQLTGEMLDFMKRHRLRSEVSED